MSNCEHKQTMISNDYQAEWCEDCGACRFRSNGKLDDWLYPKRPAERGALDEAKLREAIYEADCAWHQAYASEDDKHWVDYVVEEIIKKFTTPVVSGEEIEKETK